MKHFHFREESDGYIDYEYRQGNILLWATYIKADDEYVLITKLSDGDGSRWQIIGETPLSRQEFTNLTGHRLPVAPEVVDELVAALRDCVARLESHDDQSAPETSRGRDVLAKLEGGQP
jgi:hypothetical protein